MSQRNMVVARRVTRWYVNGRGYNSELAAYMQIAKRWVNETCWEELRAKFPMQKVPGDTFTQRSKAEPLWWAERYPAREGCNCSFCAYRRFSNGRGRGCWIMKMADYRKIAREIMSGERDMSGRPVLALPAYQKEVIENLKERNEP